MAAACVRPLEPRPDAGQAFGELGRVADRLDADVREQLAAMSPATIDRMLQPTKATRYPAAKSATRPGVTLRSSIGMRQAMDEMEKGFGLLRDRPRRTPRAQTQG